MTSSSTAPTDNTPKPPPALSFGQAADLYDAARPTYPSEALEWAFGSEPIDIAELGAGTGLLTRGLLAAGHRVTAVEPDEQMLGKLDATTSGLAASHVGAAEDIPLPDAAADAVTAGQAYHWFTPETALPEIKRVLRPGGVFCPIWNVRDESVDWVRRMSEICGSSAAETLSVKLSETQLDRFGPYFPVSEFRKFRFDKPLDGPALVRLVQSRSYYLAAGSSEKQRIVAGIEELLITHPQLAGRQTFAMPYVTYVFKTRKTA